MARSIRANVKVSHRTKFDANEVKSALGIGPEVQDEFQTAIEEYRNLAATPFSRPAMVELTGKLFAPDFASFEARDRDVLLASTPVKRVGELAFGRQRGAGLAGTQGTAWGWLNAVTEYVDHHARAHSQDNRLESAWFGKGDALKERARTLAMEAAGF
jgi:hypothetical protein